MQRILAAALFALVSVPLVACQVLLPSGTTDCKKFCKSMTSCAGPLSDASYCAAVCPLIGDQAALDCYVKKLGNCHLGDLYGACQADFCGVYGEICGGSCKVATTPEEADCQATWLAVAALAHSLGTCPAKLKAACAEAVAPKCSVAKLPPTACG